RSADMQALARLARWALWRHRPGWLALQYLSWAGDGRQPVRSGRAGAGSADAGADGADRECDVGLGADGRAWRQRSLAIAANFQESADPRLPGWCSVQPLRRWHARRQ